MRWRCSFTAVEWRYQFGALWAIGAGVASVGSLGCLYYSMSRGDMILVALLAATGVVIPVVAGIAGGNAVTMATARGMLLTVVGAIATTWGPAEVEGQQRGSNVVAAVFALGSAAGQRLVLLISPGTYSLSLRASS